MWYLCSGHSNLYRCTVSAEQHCSMYKCYYYQGMTMLQPRSHTEFHIAALIFAYQQILTSVLSVGFLDVEL